MWVSCRTVSRAVAGVIGIGLMLFGSTSPALAEPTPSPTPSPAAGCTAADLAQASGQVGTAMAEYLFAHPDVNDFFTSLRGQPNDEIRGDVRSYLDAHPQVETEINAIRQPVTELRTRCQ
jgi:heme-binding protein